MSKLTRKNIKVFGGNSSNTGKFGSAAAGSGILTSDIETIQSLAAWDNGMASATIGGQKLLPQEEMEGMVRVATYGLANIYQDGIPVYDSLTPYYTTSIVRQDNTTILYKSLIDNNVGNILTDNTKWQLCGDLSNINANLIPITTCSTASATAEKEVTLSGFILTTGVTIQVTFTNANTATTPTLNVNSTGAKAIYNEAGTIVGENNPAFFPVGSTVEFTYNGTNWVFKKRVVENYVNGTSWYRVYSDGWIEQGGSITQTISAQYTTVTFLKQHINTNYHSNSSDLYYTATNVNNAVFIDNSSLTTSSMKVCNAHNYTSGNRFLWETKGY